MWLPLWTHLFLRSQSESLQGLFSAILLKDQLSKGPPPHPTPGAPLHWLYLHPCCTMPHQNWNAQPHIVRGDCCTRDKDIRTAGVFWTPRHSASVFSRWASSSEFNLTRFNWIAVSKWHPNFPKTHWNETSEVICCDWGCWDYLSAIYSKSFLVQDDAPWHAAAASALQRQNIKASMSACWQPAWGSVS